MIHTGIIGYPLEKTLSPAMHNAAFAALDLAGEYERIPVQAAAVSAALNRFENEGGHGLNITIPHKEMALAYLTDIDPEAEAIGAINTIVFKDGRRIGHNTDLTGWRDTLASLAISLAGKSVLLIGAGGAGRAYAFAIKDMNTARFYIANRTVDRINHLAGAVSADTVPFARMGALLPEVDIVINATAVDLQAEIIPCLPVGAIYFDANYKYKPFYRSDVQVINGLLLLVSQGAHSFRLWTGLYPPLDVMKQAVGLRGD